MGDVVWLVLQQLPSVVPPQLQELLLPQRLWRVGWSDLAALQVGLVCFV
jgi:hypothetical protein